MISVLIISVLLCFIYMGLLIYYRQSWLTIPEFRPSADTTSSTTTITVIIPARNEAVHMKACLDALVNQSFPKDLYEVIVVDDHSTDQTAAIIDSYVDQNIKRIDLKDFIENEQNAFKKKAIEVAIRFSTGNLLVTTDADCITSPNWLITIASFYSTHHPAFISAPVAINYGSSFIEIFQALDFMTLQGITGASVHKKIHSMCNGANLAYEKTAFTEVNGFAGINKIASGDDMFLMHKIYKLYPDRVFFLKSKDAIVQTAPVKTIRQFFNQRIRWASKADKYDDKRILPVLLVVYLFNLLLLALPAIAIYKNTYFLLFQMHFTLFKFWMGILILKILTELFFLFPVAKFFGKQNLLWVFPIMQPFHIVYTVIAGFLGKFGVYEWKGRKVK